MIRRRVLSIASGACCLMLVCVAGAKGQTSSGKTYDPFYTPEKTGASPSSGATGSRRFEFGTTVTPQKRTYGTVQQPGVTRSPYGASRDRAPLGFSAPDAFRPAAPTPPAARSPKPGVSAGSPATPGRYLGELSANRYDPESISNPNGKYGTRYGETVTNPHSPYGSRYSPKSATNPHASDAPKIYAPDGTYLGKLSTNRYDPESVSNPYGVYGSRYSPNSVNNPHGPYGSRYSPTGVTNPNATTAPRIYGQ